MLSASKTLSGDQKLMIVRERERERKREREKTKELIAFGAGATTEVQGVVSTKVEGLIIASKVLNANCVNRRRRRAGSL